MTADDTTRPPAPMPTERGTAVENESKRHMTGPEQMATRAMNETTDPTGRCADCGGAGVIEVDSADEHRDFMACWCAADPTAGERIKAGRTKHGVGASDYLPGNVQHLVSPIVGHLRLRERDGDPADMAWMIDRLGLVLDLARQEDARNNAAAEPDAGDVRGCEGCDRGLCDGLLCDGAEPDAGDVEALAKVLCSQQGCQEHRRIARSILTSDWLAARDAAVRKEAGERIAQAIEAKYLGPDSGRGYDGSEAPDAHCRNAYDEGLYDAARIARGTR